MEAFKLNMKFLVLCLLATACSNNDSEIDPAAKNNLLSNTMLLSVKQQCLPPEIIDEEDLPLLSRFGYSTSPNNQSCLPPIDNNDGDDTVSNCIKEIFIDAEDLAFLLSQGYNPSENGEYCLVISTGSSSGGSTGGSTNGGSTTGGETSGGSTSGGSVSGGSTAGETSGGSTTGGESTGGAMNGGSTMGGSTSGGETSGGSVSGGTTTGGSTTGETSGGSTTGGESSGGTMNGGGTMGGSTSGGETSGGSTTGTTTGGSTSGGSTSGGETSGGSSTGGSTSGGSTGGDECRRGNNGHGNDRDHNDSSNPGRSNNGDGTDDDGVPGNRSHCPPVDDCEMNLIPGIKDEASFAKCQPWSVGVDRMCSRMRTGKGRYKLKDRVELVLQVVKKIKSFKEVEECKEQKTSFWGSSKRDDKKKVCKMVKKEIVTMLPICESRDAAKIKKDIFERKRLDFSRCDITGHDKKDLFVTLFSPVESADLPISAYDYDNVRFFKKDSQERGKDELSFILYGSRELRYANIREKIVVITDDNPDFNSTVNKKECDTKASPLIVHVNPNHDVAKYVELSAIDDGVEFNILGFNAEPKAHAPKQISWLNSDQYMFLVKPNRKGRVEGVDEMFGDNTKGPDADFAANGFLALAKFDENGDGLINKKDRAYRSLRLWKDKNFDGVGTPDELFTLERMSVKTIDLNYDASFYERDAHGNETVYKSVIQYNDGSLDLIFDLWFNYKK